MLSRSPAPFWWRESRGAATVEFALILPLLALIWLGGFEAAKAVSTYRKVTDATAELANVAAQYTAITKAETMSVMAAATQIMSPYSTTSLTVVLSQIQTDDTGACTVSWSEGYQGGAPLTPGAQWPLPASLKIPDTAYILVQTAYPYQTSVGSNYLGPSIPMRGQLYMSPRQIASITCSDC